MVFKTLASFPKGQKCQLCLTTKVDPEALGNICQTADVIVHYFCLLLASKIQQKGTDKQGLLGFFSRDIKKEIKRGSTIICHYCKKSGATVMCCRENCHLNFHVPCAQQKGSLHQYFNEFKSFCDKHKPHQKIPASLKKRRDLECVLCCSHIKFNVRSHDDDPLWPTCCKPQALLHKKCLQHFATSSGYYFKCPFCSNKEEFHKGMKTFGIYIPEQEASWETEPNAYRELLERDVSCNAARCRCPRGRVYSVRNSKWYMEVCILCGASGRHRGCMLENIMTETYECDVCAEVNKKFPNSVPSEDIPETSPLSDKGECHETVQQSVQENISKNLSLECEEIVIISDSESENDEVEVIDEIPPPVVTKNVRKRQLPPLQERRPGLKRQRLAEGGAETSSEVSFTIEESSPRLSQAMDFRKDDLANNSRTCETNIPTKESVNKLKDNGPASKDSSLPLMIEKVCTLSACDQIQIDELSPDSSNTNEVPIQCIDLVSDNETDQVLVISDSDTDNASIASSLLDSDSSLLDLSQIPESEKSLLLEDFSPPKNYAKEFPRRTQIQRKRRKKKKQVTPKKRKTSFKTAQNFEQKSNNNSDEIFRDQEINISLNGKNLESTSPEVANMNIPSSSHQVNESSEEESFRGFCCEESESIIEPIAISTPIVGKSVQANKACSNVEKVVHSAQHLSGNQIFLSNVDDTSKCVTLDNLNLVNKVNNIKSLITDPGENTQPICADDNTVKTTSNVVVLKLLPKDDTNHNKLISNNFKLSKCKNNPTNATVTSLQEECSKQSSIDAVICNSGPSELSRSSVNISESKIGSDNHEVTVAPLEGGSDVTSISEKDSNETLKTITKPVIDKSNDKRYPSKTKRAYKNKKPKILCSLALKQPFGDLRHSLSNLNLEQHHKKKSCNVSPETDLLPVDHDDMKKNVTNQFFSTEIDSNEVGLKILDIPINQFFNVSYNTLEDSQSPKKSELQSELLSPKSCKGAFLEPLSSEKDSDALVKLGSLKHSTDLTMGSRSSERISDLALPEYKITAGHHAGLERSMEKVPLNLDPLKNLFIESSKAFSLTQVDILSEKVPSEVSSISQASENISEMPPMVSSSSTSHAEINLNLSKYGCLSSTKLESNKTIHEDDLKSQAYSEHSPSPRNFLSLEENHSVTNISPNQTELKNSESNLKIETESGSSSLSDSVWSNCITELQKKLYSEGEENSKSLNIQSGELEPMKSLEVSNNSPELISKIKKSKPPKIRSCKEKSKDSHQSQKNTSFQFESSKISDCENPEKFGHAIKQLKLKKETKHDVKVHLQPSTLILSHVQKVLPSSEIHNKSNVSVKTEVSTERNPTIKVSVVHPFIETKCPHNESQDSPILCEELGECFKNTEQANKQEKLETTFITKDEKRLSIEIGNKLKDIGDSVTLHSEVCIGNQDHRIILNETDENKVLASKNFEREFSVENSKVHPPIDTENPCDDSHVSPLLDEEANTQENLKATSTSSERNKMPIENQNKLKDSGDSISLDGKVCFITDKDHENLKNKTNENNVDPVSKDFEKTKHDWYKTCITDCSTCYNTATLRTKHNIVMHDSIDVCFYCKDKINNTSFETTKSQVPNTCSCQEKKNNLSVNYLSVEHLHVNLYSEVFNDSKLSKDSSLIGSDLNSNYKSNNSLEKQKSHSKDHLRMDYKEINAHEIKPLNLSNVLSLERKHIAIKSEQNPKQAIPDFLKNIMCSSEVSETESQLISEEKGSKLPKIKFEANMNNDESSKTLIKSTIRQNCDEVDGESAQKVKHYYNDKITVRIIKKEVNGSNYDSSSLMSHVETFYVHNRKRLRELMKARYFSENYKTLVIYTDVCGFRYARLFIENIPDKIDHRVVFETGGDISYYLQNLIKNHENLINPQIVLIVYGNALIPDKNVFHLLQVASNLSNIKLVVTTVLSQKPRILKFNKELIFYSKRFGYYVWDITKIHFLTDVIER